MKHAFVYVTDERGFELALHSALSLALSQHEPPDIHVFCYQFTPTVGPSLARTLTGMRGNLVFDSIGDDAIEHHETCGHVTKPTLLKPLAVDRLVGRYDRIVYLDNDVLVFDDLHIGNIDFGRAPIAAVIDMDLSPSGWLRNSSRMTPGTRTEALGGYFNAGFMVFESRNWRGREFYEQYAAALDRHDAGCTFKVDCTSIDQCAMNTVFERNWIKLPPSYNMQAGAKFTAGWRTALVRHYCGPRKFMPISPFRSDRRDVRHLNLIRAALGLSRQPFPMLYELLYRANAARKYAGEAEIRQFLKKLEASTPWPLARGADEPDDPPSAASARLAIQQAAIPQAAGQNCP